MRMRGTGYTANLVDRAAEEFPRVFEPGRGHDIPARICRLRNLKAYVSEALAHRIVKLLGNVEALPFGGVDDLGAEPLHLLSTGGEPLEHLIVGVREPRQPGINPDHQHTHRSAEGERGDHDIAIDIAIDQAFGLEPRRSEHEEQGYS